MLPQDAQDGLEALQLQELRVHAEPVAVGEQGQDAPADLAARRAGAGADAERGERLAEGRVPELRRRCVARAGEQHRRLRNGRG